MRQVSLLLHALVPVQEKEGFGEDESGFNWAAARIKLDSKLHLHKCLHRDESVNKFPSHSIALWDTPWLHSSVWSRQGRPSSFLFLLILRCLLSTANTNMLVGRPSTHLDLPPPSLHSWSHHIHTKLSFYHLDSHLEKLFFCLLLFVLSGGHQEAKRNWFEL